MSVIPGSERLLATTALDGRRGGIAATRRRSTASCGTSRIALRGTTSMLSFISAQPGFRSEVDIPPGRGRRSADRRVPPRVTGTVRIEAAAVRVRIGQAADRLARLVGSAREKSKAAFRRAKMPAAGSRTSTHSSRRARRSSCTDMSGAARRCRDGAVDLQANRTCCGFAHALCLLTNRHARADTAP